MSSVLVTDIGALVTNGYPQPVDKYSRGAAFVIEDGRISWLGPADVAPACDSLKAGRWDAGQAAWNMRMLSTTPPTGKVLGATHSDLAFTGNYAVPLGTSELVPLRRARV